MLANSILIMYECRSGRKTVPQPDQPTHQLTNPTQHEVKEASIMGVRGKMEQGHLRSWVVLWGPLVFHGVEFAGGEVCLLQIPLSSRVSCSPTWDCSKLYLIFQTLYQEGTLTDASERLCCPNTGFLCTKRLMKLRSEILLLLLFCFGFGFGLVWFFSIFSFAYQCLVIRALWGALRPRTEDSQAVQNAI